MSDSPDEMMELIEDRIGEAYAGFVMVCASLPVPIELPTGLVMGDSIVAAIQRVSEIATDQPMPEDQRAGLYGAAVLMLGAMDLYGVLQNNLYRESRAAAALAVLAMVRGSLVDLAEWLGSDGR
ncbi:hypothetical protein AB0P17_36550 [Streptomyces sp. NPDC088124]|uniref:hypothetical protein n=1 Tax=Streptomyces sp. NPDC088124 TaxID=3154654 RepID=UPI0034486510